MGFLITEQSGLCRNFRGRARYALLLAAALPALACGGASAPSCPSGPPIELDLAAWASRLEAVEATAAAASEAGYDQLLGELRLAPLPQVESGPDGEGGPMKLLSVETLLVARGGGAAAARLVVARFAGAAGAESLRAQLLQPLADRQDLFCPLGDELSADREPYAEPCLEPHEGPARSLELVQLVAPDRDAVVARDAGGWCGGGSSRGDRFVTSFWGVEEGRLVRYLEAVTLESWYQSPMPPTEARRGEIELSDDWPKTITVTEVVECWPAEEATSADDCEPFERTLEYRYSGRRYSAAARPSPTAAAPVGTPFEETRP